MKNVSKRAAKFFAWKPSARLICVFALLTLAVVLIPLIRIAPYAVPWYDDYNYGRFARMGIEMYGGFTGAIKGAVECARSSWYAWQGTYSSIFFMSLMPAVWGEDKYFLGPLFILTLLVLGVFVLVKTLVRDVIKGDKTSCLTMQAAAAIMVLMFIYSAQAGFYWYNAGIHYVGMHAFAMMFAACLIGLLTAEKKGVTVALIPVSMLLAFLTAGANYVTALQSGLVLLSIGAAGIFWYKRPGRAFALLPALCVWAAGFYKNVSAPGNSVRARSFEGWGLSPLDAVGQSFVEAVKHIGEFTGFITLAALALLIPIIWRMVKGCPFSFRYPLLVAAWSFCLYATGFTPSLFSMGSPGLSRTLNAVKITWQLLLLINTVYTLGWLRRFLEEKKHCAFEGRAMWWFYPLMGIVMLLIFSVAPNQAGNYSAYGAYYYVHTGEAYNFHQQYLERVEELKSDEPVIVFEPYRFKPWFLCIGDLSENPDAEENRTIAEWYGKSSVATEPAKEEK